MSKEDSKKLLEDFKVELSELLKKYKAEIYIQDTNLLYGQAEYIVVEFNNDGDRFSLGTDID